MNLADAVQKYIAMRDEKARLKAEFEAAVEPIQKAMDTLEVQLLALLDQAGVESVKTPMGTAYISKRTSGSVVDKDAFLNFVREHNEWPLMEVRCSKNNIETFIDQHNGELPPGINWSEERVVNFRRKA